MTIIAFPCSFLDNPKPKK